MARARHRKVGGARRRHGWRAELSRADARKWYCSLALICLLGVALVVYSRYERQHPAAAVQPTIGSSLVLQALGVRRVRHGAAEFADEPEPVDPPVPGIRTDGDGVIQSSSHQSADAGDNATLGPIRGDQSQVDPHVEHPAHPGQAQYVDGQKCPPGTPDAGKVAQLQIKVWPQLQRSPASNAAVRSVDSQCRQTRRRELITVAFVPPGHVPVPKPSAITAMLTDRAVAATSTDPVDRACDDAHDRDDDHGANERHHGATTTTVNQPTTTTTKTATTATTAAGSEGHRPPGRRGDDDCVRSPTRRPSSFCRSWRCR